eukprot:2330866-Rhodomonas_salina.4
MLVVVYALLDAVFRLCLAPGGCAQLGDGRHPAGAVAAVQAGVCVSGLLGLALSGYKRDAVHRLRGRPHGARALGRPHAVDDGQPVHAAVERDVARRHCARGAVLHGEHALVVHRGVGAPHVRARARRSAAAAALHRAAFYAHPRGRGAAPVCAGLLSVGVCAALGCWGRLVLLSRRGW